jgi:hypothetical protein
MTKKILSCMVVMIFLACLLSLSHAAILFKIGDRDSFGYTAERLEELEGQKIMGTTGDPADFNRNGKLEPGESLPDFNGHQHFDELPPDLGGDGFDHRTEAEKTAEDGAQFTDVTYNLDKDPIWTRMYEVEFIFDVSSLAGLRVKSATLDFIYADFDGDCPDFCEEICDDVFANGEFIGEVSLTDPEQGGISKAKFDVTEPLTECLTGGCSTLHITFESADSIEFDVVNLRVNLETENARPLVRLRELSGALDEDIVPGGPKGTYTATYRMKNKGAVPIWAPFLVFRPQSPGILLLNADGGPGGRGATFTPDVGPDVTLEPGEKVEFTLVIGLTEKKIPKFKLRVKRTPLSP